MNKDIGWFEISMKNSKFGHLLETLRYLFEDVQSHLFSYLSGRTIPLEVPSWAKLHDQVNVVGSCDDLVELDNVRVF